MNSTEGILEEVARYVQAAAAEAVATMLPHWYAVQTVGRQEKSVTERLCELELSLYLPLVTEMHRWSDRRKRMDVPLFPGYTFLYSPMNESIRLTVVRAPGVTGFVTSQGKPASIPDAEIERVQKLLLQKEPLLAHTFLTRGKRVRIRGGALDGVEGILVGTNADWSLVVSVELIQRSIALRLKGYDIEPV